jgi:formate-nitrite transporter family protein
MCARQTDDLEGEGSEPLRAYETMLRLEIRQASHEFDRPANGLLLSGVSAGLGVGVSMLLVAIARSLAAQAGQADSPAMALLYANLYSVGFILVVLGRMDLFTEFTTIAILPVLRGRRSVGALGRLWGLIYVGNQVGAAMFAGLAVVLAPALGVAERAVFVQIADQVTRHPGWVMVLSGVLAGWLMGLMSWLITGGRDTISQVFFVWLVAMSIGLAHLHHSVTGSVEVLAGMLTGEQQTLMTFARFLWWTTLGNIIGGVLFAASVHYSLQAENKAIDDDQRQNM